MYLNKGSTTGAFIIDQPLTIRSTELPILMVTLFIMICMMTSGMKPLPKEKLPEKVVQWAFAEQSWTTPVRLKMHGVISNYMVHSEIQHIFTASII